MIFQVIWFVLWGVLWAVYFMLDGFDLGAGMLMPFVAGSEAEKRAVLNSIGPVWDGNQVWLITAGGATFAAFPGTYALMFSYLYTALLLLLFSLIIRGVALEFRGKAEGAGWRRGWDIALWLGSLLPSLLFGVAFGNIFMGLPMDARGYHGGLLSLLNPYGLLTGAFFVLLFLVHGALWTAIKTGGRTEARAARAANGFLWYALLVAAVAFLAYTAFATKLYANYLKAPVLILLPAAAVLSLLAIKIFAGRDRYLRAFFASCATILTVAATGVAGLYPNLIPSSINPASSLTLLNSSSSPYTLKIMTAVAAVFIPIVVLYQIWTYRVFRHKTLEEAGGESPY